MSRNMLVCLAALGLAAASGCQKSGTAETSTTATPAPVYVAPAAASSAYTMAYAANVDTPWMYSSTDTTAAGTLKRGDTVYLRGIPPSTGMVSAKTTDGRMVYVRAADLIAK